MLTQVLDVVDLLDSPQTSGESLAAYLRAQGAEGAEIHVETITGDDGSTDFVRVVIPGSAGKRSGGSAPTLGVIGRLGGAGARPSGSASSPTATAQRRRCRQPPSCCR